MANSVQLTNVRTWYDECGEGIPLVLLHGGVVDSRFFEKNVGALASRFHVFAPDARGHGHTPDVDGAFSYGLLAQDLIEFLETVVGGPAHLVGHSMGAVTALMVALGRPDLVRRLVSISGLFHNGGLLATGRIDVAKLVAERGARYGEVSPDGEEHFRVVVEKVAKMGAWEPMMSLSEVSTVTSRTLVMVADDDIIAAEHTLALYRAIGDSELAVVPGTSHPLLREKPDVCNSILVQFLADDPVPTTAPVYRTPKQPES